MSAHDVACVALVEDEALFRDLLRRALEQTGKVQVLGSFGDAGEALSSSVMARVDAVLLDIDLGGEDGIALGRQLRGRHAGLGIVLLSNHAHLVFARGLIAADLTGWAYLLKKSVRDVHTILRAIEGVRAGQVVLDPQLAQGQPLQSGRFSDLTPRQAELWSLITQGYSNAAIAAQLGLIRIPLSSAPSGTTPAVAPRHGIRIFFLLAPLEKVRGMRTNFSESVSAPSG